MTSVEVFRFPVTQEPVRTVLRDGEPWLVGADVTTILGYGGGARNALARLPERMKGVELLNTPGGPQRMTVINEAGAYRLVMRSNVAAAERFQDWLAEEVIPSITRTGRYEVEQRPMTELEMAQRYVAALEREQALAEQVAALEPSATAWDVLASAHGDYSVREAAFILNRDPEINTGQNRLFKLLREWGLIDRRDTPYADHERHVRLRARSYEHPKTGDEVTTQQVRITAEGLRYLHRRMGGTDTAVLPETA